MDISTTETRAPGVSESVDRIAGNAHQAVDRIAGAASNVASRLNSKGESLMATKDRLMEASVTYAKDHPFIAIGIAVAAGYVLSRVIR